MINVRLRLMHERGVVECPRRIASKANVWADVGSRPELGGCEAVREMVEGLGLQYVRLPVPDGWRSTDGLRLPDPVW